MPVQPTVHPAHRASGNCSALSEARLLSAVATLRDALAPDLALNLPVVLDRAALLDVLSALCANTPTPTPAPATAPSLVRVTITALLADMTNGQRCVAIHAAGIPPAWRKLSDEQIITLALTGIARLGLPEIRRIDAYSGELTLDPSPAATRQLRRIWRSARLRQAATDLAYRLTSLRKAAIPTAVAA